MKSYVDCCSDFKVNQIEVLVVNLNAVIDENDDVKVLDLQADLESNFLPMGIAHSVLIRNTDYFFKHFDGSIDGDGGSDIETCQ